MERVMKDSGIEWIGDIPEKWDLLRLQFCLKEVKVNNNPIQTTQVLSLMKDVGVLPYEEKGDVGNKSKEDVSEYHLAFPNTIVLNCMNILIGSVGISDYFGCVSPVYYVFKETDECNLRYVNYIFNTRELQKELRKYAKGILEIRLRVSADDIFKRKIPFPSKSVQKRIADTLDCKCSEIDALRADIDKEIATLEKYKKSVVFRTVTYGLRKEKLKKTRSDVWTDIPVSWSLVDIKYLFEIVKRIAGKEGYEIIAITQQGLKYKDISTNEGQLAADYSGYQFVHPGDFAMNHMDLLTGWVDLSDKFGVTSPDYRVFRLRDSNRNDRVYYKHLMQCCYMNKIFYSLGQGVSNLGRWRLQAPVFNDFQVPVPPVDEQREIGAYLDEKILEINSVITSKKEEIASLDAYKKALIYEYVTGKKEV